ncbi:MAG: prepilin-type N-terminal cleavage/methylation domain-containing protein [Deltaproteobacteria bacterium]|nr:prepilin-type N-terminal cleavage/methylation domain-containing protein [Deltaproteobacteria bacterium]
MNKIANNSGFTLIEVLVAMVILLIGLLGTAALITGIIRGNKVSNRITTATMLAQDKMEKIKRAGYAGADAEAGTEPYGGENFPLYKRITDIVSGNPETGMNNITVTVYWDSDNGQVKLQTILAE